MMVIRAVNNSCIIHHRPFPLSLSLSLSSLRFRSFRPSLRFKYGQHSSVSSRSVFSLVDIVLEELKALRTNSPARVRASNNLGLTSSGVVEDKFEKQELQAGLLLEYRKESGKVLLAVAQRPDGKRNWMVSDQNGVLSSIKPQQITYIVPGIEKFAHSQIPEFMQKAQENLDSTILELAWGELLGNNKSVTAEELAEMIYGAAEPLESYCAHTLLSNDEVYFSVRTNGYSPVYTPRPSSQVEELQKRKLAKEALKKELEEFVESLISAKKMPFHEKPSRSSWLIETRIRHRIEALAAYAIDGYVTESQKRVAREILLEMGLVRTASSALKLLIDIGYFPVHVNVDLLKTKIRTEHSEEILSAAEVLLSGESGPCDMDKDLREDLTHLKVYAIDVDEADELDDALSAMRLQDGRIKVWIHVADPTSIVQPGSILDKNALSRGTSIFLPTATYPMFPEKLAMQAMSLKQGEYCNAVTVSVVLHSDGSIAEYSVGNTVIKPTYMLTYESATELLYLNLEEEADLRILSEAATRRSKWRRKQGAIDMPNVEGRIKVPNPDDPEPQINLYVEDQRDPAMRLVTEMMILCGEVIAAHGSHYKIPLPYRGQPQSNIDKYAFSRLPEGPVRTSAIVKTLRAAELDFRGPLRHGVLGVPGYVQFTSPIRRYMDLLAHYQIKAHLRGEFPPFTAGQLEGIAAIVNLHQKNVKKLCNSSFRYWIIEYLRRQPKERTYRALILRFIKDRVAALLLTEVGLQASVSVLLGSHVGDEIDVLVEEAHPRKDVLLLKHVPSE